MASVFGYEIDSEIPLGRLRAAPGPRGTIRVARGDPGMLDEPAEVIAFDAMPLPGGDGDAIFIIGRVPRGHLVACSVTGAYRFADGANTVEVDPSGRPEAWEHRLLAVILPLMLSVRGDLALHAAVIEIEGKAALLCGPPGRGKSTLALTFANLCHRVLSEDGAVLDREGGPWMVWPAAAGARIHTRGAGAPQPKVIHELPGGEPQPIAPGALVLLDERGGSGRVEAVERPHALVSASAHLMYAGGRDSAARPFAALASLLGTVPAFRVSMPDDLDRLPEAAARLASQIALANRWPGE
jgi:hypothetical protein